MTKPAYGNIEGLAKIVLEEVKLHARDGKPFIINQGIWLGDIRDYSSFGIEIQPQKINMLFRSPNADEIHPVELQGDIRIDEKYPNKIHVTNYRESSRLYIEDIQSYLRRCL
ncbi:unnamed protein product [marine sediment metagenome]|uniref:Uncharacterized protein n=1 Tax=marine sediment metagenome TaxID=412755 RepID=X1NLF9_9ZZZZ